MRPTIQQAAMTGLGLLILAASGARAEEPHTLQEGARVRATMAVETAPIGNHPIRLEGLLSDMDEATITLVTSPDKPPVAILRVEVSKLEMYKGKKSRGTGALIGFGVGAAVGALIGNPSGYEEPATVNERFSRRRGCHRSGCLWPFGGHRGRGHHSWRQVGDSSNRQDPAGNQSQFTGGKWALPDCSILERGPP